MSKKVIVYKDGEQLKVGSQQARILVLNDGWSYDAKKTAQPKKAKIEAEAEVKGSDFDDPDNHDYSETINVDFGTIDEEK